MTVSKEMRSVLWASALSFVFVTAGCDVDVNDPGQLPNVEVTDEGRLPDVDVTGPDVRTGEKEVTVPTVEVTPADENAQ